MAFDIGSVIAKVDADISGFKQGMAEAKSHLGGFKDGIASAADGVKSFAEGVSVASAVVAGGLALMAKSALNSAASFEQNRIAFETMLGSAEEARKLLKEISDFAMKTPFELPQLVEGSKKLLAYNVAAKDIIPTMKMLGDITSGVGVEKMPQLILAFGQVKAATKLTGMELRQFSEAGVPLLQALVDQANKAGGSWQTVGGAAKKTKVDVAELNDKLAIASQRLKEAEGNAKTKQSTLMSLRNTVQNYTQKIAEAGAATSKTGKVFVKTTVTAQDMIKKISDGEVTFDQVQKALAGMTAEGGKFFNGMERQSLTFNGVVSNIKDQIGRIGRAIFGINEYGDIAEGSLFAKISQAANAFLQFLNDSTPQILSFFNQIGNVAQTIGKALEPLINWIVANKEIVLTFLTGVGGAIAALLALAPLIVIAMNPVILIFAAIAIAAGLLYTAWQTNFWGIRDTTMAVINELQLFFNNILMPIIKAVADWVAKHWTDIVNITQGAWKIITGIIQVAWGIIYGIFATVLALLQGDYKKAWDAIVHGTETALKGITDLLSGMIQFILGWGGALFDELTAPFRRAWDEISKLVQKIKDALDFTKRHSPSIVDILNHSVNAVNDALGGLSFGANINAQAAGLAVSNGGAMSNITNVRIDMAGAIIADTYGAQMLAENMGDAIIKRLQQNIRI